MPNIIRTSNRSTNSSKRDQLPRYLPSFSHYLGGDFAILKREVRVILYNVKSGQYIGNTCCVKAEWKQEDKDIWRFNLWKKVGPNPLIFTTKDEQLAKDDDVSLIFEFVMMCKMGQGFKDISCGFCSLKMAEIRAMKKRNHIIEIKGGSPDSPIDHDPCNFKEDMSFFKKLSRGTILQQLKMDTRYYPTISAEGKYNIQMLPRTCIINKKLMHFLVGYRNYLAKKLCKETSDNAGFSIPTGNHIIKTFPFIIDNPDVCEHFLNEWHTSVVKKMPKASQKNLDFLTDKAEAYISRIYLVKYADSFGLEEGKEYESAAWNPDLLKARQDMITYALKADMPGISYTPKVRIEAMTTFKPFNIRELELDVFDSESMRMNYYQNEFEQKGLKVRSKSRNKRGDEKDERKSDYERDRSKGYDK